MTRAFGSLFDGGGDIAKYIDLPLANYATLPFDNVTKVRLSDLVLNPRISNKVYELKLPRGTELLNMQGEPIKD